MQESNIPLNRNLSKLDLSNMNLKEIPAEVFEFKNLRKLNLSNNSIKKIPKEIVNLKLLEVLDISNNKISNFFAKTCELRKLKNLNLNNNQITSLPKQIGNLQNLKKFSIANNKISSLPEEFANLSGLTSLNLSRNSFTELPFQVYALTNIKQLWICSLPMKKVFFNVLVQNLRNLQSFYAFGTINSQNPVDENYYSLSKVKGNSIRKLLEVAQRINNDFTSSVTKIALEEKSEKVIFPIVTPEKKDRPIIFISYSHKDKDTWLIKVQTHLKVLKNQNVNFEYWDDTKIKAGENWKEKIATALSKCKVAILIVSTDFLASDFIHSDELPELLNNANNEGTRLLSLIVRPCRFKNQAGLKDLQSINEPSNPLSKMTESEQEENLIKLVDRVEEILNE